MSPTLVSSELCPGHTEQATFPCCPRHLHPIPQARGRGPLSAWAVTQEMRSLVKDNVALFLTLLGVFGWFRTRNERELCLHNHLKLKEQFLPLNPPLVFLPS